MNCSIIALLKHVRKVAGYRCNAYGIIGLIHKKRDLRVGCGSLGRADCPLIKWLVVHSLAISARMLKWALARC